MSYIGTATNKKLLEVFNMMKNGELELRPSFQRKLVWNNKHKENFIETILLNLPFPEIYFADGIIDLETQTSKTLVVDGQQRLSTIYQYITGSDEFNFSKIKKFKELSPTEQTSFYDYKIVVRDLGRINNSQIIEIFQRINSVQYALNAMEIRNALYEGEFIETAKLIIEKNKYLKNIDIFSETELSRMRDIEFILLIMATIEEGGYFAGNKLIEAYVKNNDENYPNKQNIINYINEVTKLFIDMKLPLDSIWYRKSSFFTLIIELIMFKIKFGLLPNCKDIIRTLNELENQIQINKTGNIEENRFAEYYYYTFQGTNSRKSRLIRGKLLEEFLLKIK